MSIDARASSINRTTSGRIDAGRKQPLGIDRLANGKLIRAEPVADGRQLQPNQIKQWREQGYTFVNGLTDPEIISKLARSAAKFFPEPGTTAAANISDFGSTGAMNFPSQVESLNQVTLDESLLQAVATLLGDPVTDIRLTQSDVWAKYGHAAQNGIQDNSDQRIHVDYPNHTLAHPTPWHRPEAVEMIIYLSDAEGDDGGTAVVPRQGPDDPDYRWPIIDSPGIGDLRYINDRSAAEAYFAGERPELANWRRSLYEREKRTRYKKGDVLLYRHDTWHRGTPLAMNESRIVHNITFRKAASEWISTLHVGWAWQAYRDNKFLEKLIAGASLNQRAVMGFPQPGSDYWCSETLQAVAARYGIFGFDIGPYANPDTSAM